MALPPAEPEPVTLAAADARTKTVSETPTTNAIHSPLRWLWLAIGAAAIAAATALLLLLLQWRDEQQTQQSLFERNVNAQVQAIDQQLRHFDTVISDLARVLRQTSNEKNNLFSDLTESWPQRYQVMHFVAFYRADENNTLRLREVVPSDTPDLRSGSALLRVVPNARRELWADARQWRSHFVVQTTEQGSSRLNILYPVVSRENQFDAAQLLGVLHLGIDIKRFILTGIHHAEHSETRLRIFDSDENNASLYDSAPSEINDSQSGSLRHAEFSLLTGGLNWRLHFSSPIQFQLSRFLWRNAGIVLAFIVSTGWLLFSLWLTAHLNRLQKKLLHAKRSLLHARELLHQTETELDNFSYCVSHDLRAPLRHIRSYSQILLLDHGSQLDQEGLGLSQRIADSGAKMSRLIDDLLRLSRVTRSPMKPVPCDLSDMVSSVYVELRQEFAALDVRFKCEPAINVVADPALIRIALNCLMHNALKYSSKRVLADIQFGIDGNSPSETVYFIRDNGIGFDMRYVDRLFAPFNRLHGEDDFGGTGIGLATAKRVILRHGGRIWVKSMPNEGTTMYFTLPAPASRALSNASSEPDLDDDILT